MRNTFPRMSPTFWVSLTLILITLYSAISFFMMTQRPWIGVRFSPNVEHQNLLVKSVDSAGPASGRLEPGDQVMGIRNTDGNVFPLAPIYLEEPNNLQTYGDFNQLIHAQEVVWPLLHEPVIKLVLADGGVVELFPERVRPFSSIPPVYWAYTVIPPLAVLVGLIVLLRNPWQLEAILFHINGYAYYLTVMMTMSFDRELAIAPGMMTAFAFLENVGTNLFNATLLVILLTFPKHFVPVRIALGLGAAILLFPLNSLFQVYQLPVHAFLIHFFFLKPIYLVTGYMQWRTSKNAPQHRAIVKWMLLSLSVALTFGFTFFVIPTTMGSVPLLPIEAARLLIALFYIGMALAIARYRLFDVERWWFRFFTWLIGGALVIVFDFILVLTLHLSPLSALSGALILAGFVYFPLRQWLLARLIKDDSSRLEQGIGDLAASVTSAGTDEEFEAGWRKVLRSQFLPGELGELNSVNDSKASISRQGLSLQVPKLTEDSCYQLQGKNEGKQLFSPEDVGLVNSLLDVARTSRDSARSREQVARLERHRIMQDLHDTVGAKLLTMVHRAEAPEFEMAARDVLTTLRETVKLSTATGAISLETLAADMRAECYERASEIGVSLNWETKIGEGFVSLDPTQALTLTHVLRESLSNAMKHAHPSVIAVSIEVVGDQLLFSVSNDGINVEPDHWEPGFGINNMIKRVKGLGGDLNLVASNLPSESVKLSCVIPLVQAS